MRIKSSVMVGTVLGVMTICAARADNLLTSKAYVDARGALKQDIITAGTTGNVVTYNGAVNGQTQFDELAVLRQMAHITPVQTPENWQPWAQLWPVSVPRVPRPLCLAQAAQLSHTEMRRVSQVK